MITLITGAPGNGKTLFALNYIHQLALKQNRQVYYSGIKDLTLPWELFGAPSKDPEKPYNTDISEWYKLPKGCIIVVDEAQRAFRPRGTGAKVPEYVEHLETHRHDGYDIFLITQAPRLVETNVRALIGQHFDVKRKFGTPKAIVAEWSTCTEPSKANRLQAVRHDFKYPAESYGWYKSAEVHTVQKRVPMRVYMMYGAPLVLLALCWLVWSRMSHVAQPKADEMSHAAQGLLGGSPNGMKGGVARPVKERLAEVLDEAQVGRAAYIAASAPRIDVLPYSAVKYDKVTTPTRAPVPAGCAVSATRKCQCFTQQATLLPGVPEDMCLQIVAHGFFLEFDPEGQRERQEKPSETARNGPTASAKEVEPATGGAPSAATVTGLPSGDVVRTSVHGVAGTLPPRSNGLFGRSTPNPAEQR